jgi:cytochrome c553
MKKYLLAVAFLGYGLAVQPASAIERGDAARGSELANTCAGCHGPEGNSTNPQFPRLAGQYADYIVQALLAYKRGQRENAIMQGIVAELSEQDMEDLGAYYFKQRGDLYQKEF